MIYKLNLSHDEISHSFSFPAFLDYDDVTIREKLLSHFDHLARPGFFPQSITGHHGKSGDFLEKFPDEVQLFTYHTHTENC